jgi:molybdopterin-containing oxidoreductase family iron-sulfur binding subunit
MARYGLIVDLNVCTGCMTCVTACKQENLTKPGIQWARILELESPEADQITFMRKSCMHCDNPPCVEACPSKAISRRADGIVLIDQKKCVGSKACIDACPYGVPRLNPKEEYFPGNAMPYEKNVAPFRVQIAGKASMCTLCAHRVDKGREPACVEGCPSRALTFGDLDDPKSVVRKKLWQSKQLLADQGTHPKVSYITPKNIFRSSEQGIRESK